MRNLLLIFLATLTMLSCANRPISNATLAERCATKSEELQAQHPFDSDSPIANFTHGERVEFFKRAIAAGQYDALLEYAGDK